MFAVLLYVLACITGCFAPTTTGLIGIASGGAPVAFNHLGMRKNESFWVVRYDDAIAATQQAIKALSLEIKDQEINHDHAKFCLTNNKEKIDILIEPRSETVMYIKFDVGWFGSVAFGRLVLQQIIDELNETGSFLESWTSDNMDFETPVKSLKTDTQL